MASEHSGSDPRAGRRLDELDAQVEANRAAIDDLQARAGASDDVSDLPDAR